MVTPHLSALAMANQHSSKTYMFLLKCLHEMDENVTHPFPLIEPSLTPSRMPKPSVRKHCFQNKMFLFLKTIYRISVKSIGQPSEVNCWVILRNSHGSSSKMNCWKTLQGNSSENLPLKFLSQPFSLFFSFMSCTLTYCSRLPSAYEMHYAISQQSMLIY